MYCMVSLFPSISISWTFIKAVGEDKDTSRMENK